ncbi:MAG: class I SAM-dependent methyltransferase [bacterium]|nr:class I SAM-dependent methyltransferase [bacterium]
MRTKTIKKCRVCGSYKLKSVFSLGNLHVNAFLENPKDIVPKAPLTPVFCKNCSLVQLKHTADIQSMYAEHYWYKSGLNPVIREDLKDIATSAIKMAKMNPGDTFLDIGANDGTLLSCVPKKYFRVGVEPAPNLQNELGEHCDLAHRSLWEEVKELPQGRKVKVITAVSMLYDLDDPNVFIKKVKDFLSSDGIFVVQLMTLKPMIEYNDVGNICHEHLEYYSYPSLRYLFEKNGLEIFKVEENGINGGSYRLFTRHLKNGSVRHPEKIGERELENFVRRVEANKKKTVDFIKREVKKGKKVYGYGASTKGNTILQWSGIDSTLLSGIAEKHPEKIGKFTVGTAIPIVSEEVAREKADYFYVLPWGFFDAFLEKEKGWRSKGGKFIVSTPEFRVV